ncbi:MAG TPA: PKD domain-containing protein [Gemmatimonadota bacterium]|nr:PKD domain-containing protein [Gemmatimonadota bacterium]
MPTTLLYSSISRLTRAFFAFSLVSLAGCDSPTSPPPFNILSPSSDTVSVLPGGSVRFEIQIDPGIAVEYVIDDQRTEPGPLLLFRPTNGSHIVTAVVRSTGPVATLLEKDFLVVVEVPGNIPPEVVVLNVDTGREAERDTVRASTIVRDPDGSVQSIAIDFGDGVVATSIGKNTQFQAAHVYAAPGNYWVRATVTDSVQISSSDSVQIDVLPPNQLPTGSLTVSGPTEGDAPLAATLIPSGADSDGTIVTWEIDEGDGKFRQIQPFEQIQVSYDFREVPYRPLLRLTDDDGDSAIIEADVQVVVFRAISGPLSSSSATGNPRFNTLSIAPAVFADGQDPLRIDIQVKASDGGPAADVPLRIRSLRSTLNGSLASVLNGSEKLAPDSPRTAADGRATVHLTSLTSTRVEAVPGIGFQPFALVVEADRGHGQWIEVGHISAINAETVVSGGDGGRVFTNAIGNKVGYCPGDTVEIRVVAKVRAGTPLPAGSPAKGKYTEIRWGQFSNPALLPVQPAPGYANRRTDSAGEVIFRYTTKAADQAQIIKGWVDGQPLNELGWFNFKVDC